MAQKTIVTLIDDLNGEEIENVQTVEFTLDGNDYEIDLGPDNHQDFYDFLGTYIAAARKVKRRAPAGGRAARRPATSDTGPVRRDKEQTKAVRRWLQNNGYEVSERGRIPGYMEEAYNTGTPAPQSQPDEPEHQESDQENYGHLTAVG